MKYFKLKQKTQFSIISKNNNVFTLENVNTKSTVIIHENDFNDIFVKNDNFIEYRSEHEPIYSIHKRFYNFKNVEDKYLILVNNIGSLKKVSLTIFEEHYETA